MEKSDGAQIVWAVYEHIIEARIYPNEVTVRLWSVLCVKKGS